MRAPMVLAVAVFVASYVLIITRRLRWLPIGRPAGALVGACLMVSTRVLTPEQAYGSVDHSTLGLLFGMMLINAQLERAGAFHRVAAVLDHHLRSPRVLLCAVAAGAAFASALLVNDAVCLMGTPVVLALARRRRLHPLPLLLALATGSNVGGVMTLTGTPQCMIIGQMGRISYASYAAVMVPVGLVALLVLCAVLLVVHGRPRPEDEPPSDTNEGAREPERFDDALLWPSVIALAFVTGGFVLHFDLAWTAMLGASLLLIAARRDAALVLARVDWSVLLFFTGLFIIVGGLRASGAADIALRYLGARVRGGAGSLLPLSFAWMVGSNLVSNVPFVLLAGPWVARMPDTRLMWLALSMATTFAGNLTLLGSVANIIVAEGAGERGGMTFGAYLRVGFPATILTTLAGAATLLALQASGWIAYSARW